MPPALTFLTRSLTASGSGGRRNLAWACLALLHCAALAVLLWAEVDFVSRIAFVLAWGVLNFLWLGVLRRPLAAAALSLSLVAIIVLLSRFKHDILLMTINFLDIMIVDADTFSFLLTVYPNLKWMILGACAVVLPAVVLLWWLDPLRVQLPAALSGAAACVASLCALSLAVPSDLYEEFANTNYVSKFARSGVTGVVDLYSRGYLESDAAVSERLTSPAAGCAPAAKLPHIVMVFDEGSFDITRIPGIKAGAGYEDYFRSFDGKSRALLVEGAGGPSWYTEYNVLTGLSVRSYGRFADFVTRIAADRVERGLPRALRECGYKTFSLYPMWGSFAGARAFQQTAGIEHFLDSRDLGTRGIEPDRFYYDAAVRLMAKERGDKPLFLFAYTAANHFPWNFRYKPELTPNWRDTGNTLEVDEYLRRQAMSATDYAEFVSRLKRELPNEPILIVRFGDHQPSFAKHLVDPALDESVLARRIAEADPRFLTTYYAIEGINFRPAELSSALDTLDAPYLPLVVMEAAGVPLTPSFAEQKRILRRCNGLFYRCGNGAEARRFNRLLIDAGLIKRL
ncbi:MAG TPA: LTA synthase family protein [Xanthobacteraceae bacterium]|nr:LTA synthase family protein [Xanthobacteraceae bacterium]